MTKYILMVFAGACSYGILSTFVKLSYQEGYTAADISASQAFTGMSVLWLLVFAQKKDEAMMERKTWLPLLFTGSAIGLSSFVYYISVRYIPASLAIVILMQFTWMGMLLELFIFKKKPGWLQLAATAVILIGTMLAGGMLDTGIGEVSVKGFLWAFASALLYAIYLVANSRVAKEVPALKKSAVMMTGSTIGLILINAQQLIMNSHYDLNLLKWAVFLAFFGTIIPPLLFARGIPKIGAGISAIIMTAELPVAIICSHLLLKEPLTPLKITGVIIMLLAMVLMNIKTGFRQRLRK
ncbi:EamA family transporter [Chitinophaga tropicalis]|uniref:EamA family transporter n=1 Tax=Chitinophaga tropicalis TaxID=2683588 RepID=A0A7K1UBT4_9BACT|nr:DMT family transporter [Chitinophaga tropicalis]MVT11844.1 EamA family transporter [Chitinophaga tropicalis]